MATAKEIRATLAILGAAYPTFDIPKETIAVYESELSDVPAGDLISAAHIHIKSSRWFPTIAELRSAYDAKCAAERKELKQNEWRKNLELAKREALPQSQAKKRLAALTEASANSLLRFRQKNNAFTTPSIKQYEVGAGASDEDWEERKRKTKES